jgi:hypothetical protein
MPSFEGLGFTPLQTTVAGAVFAAVMAALWAWSWWRGRTESPQKPTVRNYAFTGQLTDLQPVKELVEVAAALLVQVSRIATTLEEETTRRERERDADEAAARRERERDVNDAVDRRNRGRKPPAST